LNLALGVFYPECPSPDGNGILFFFSLKKKRYSVQQETAPENSIIDLFNRIITK
jgi:hypothetical protein